MYLAMENKMYKFIIIVFNFTIAYLLHFQYNIFDYDIEFFKYCGMVLSKGQIPYKDFFDHKAPLIYLLHYIAFELGHLGMYIIASTLSSISSVFIFKLSSTSNAHTKIALLISILFTVMLYVPIVNSDLGLTRMFTTIFLVYFFYILFSSFKPKFLCLGIISALLFWMQQEQVLITLPFFIFALYEANKKEHESYLINILKAFFSFFILSLVMILVLYNYGIATLFWQEAFLFNFKSYHSNNQEQEVFKYIFKALAASSYILPMLFLIVLALINTTSKINYNYLLASITTIILTPIAYYVSKMTILYYIQPFAAVIPILLTKAVSNLNSFQSKVVRWGLFVLIIFVAVNEYKKTEETQRRSWVTTSPELRYFDGMDLNDGDLYVLGESRFIYLYNTFQIASPSKWIYHHFWYWYPSWDTNLKISKSILNDLEMHKTKFIVDYLM
jgi:hypothetical protein